MHKLILFITAVCLSFHPLWFGIVPQEISVKKCIIIKEKNAKTNRVKESLIWGSPPSPEGKHDA